MPKLCLVNMPAGGVIPTKCRTPPQIRLGTGVRKLASIEKIKGKKLNSSIELEKSWMAVPLLCREWVVPFIFSDALTARHPRGEPPLYWCIAMGRAATMTKSGQTAMTAMRATIQRAGGNVGDFHQGVSGEGRQAGEREGRGGW